MQKIKKIVKILFGVLGTFVGLTMLLGRSSKKKTIEIKKDIKNNELETKKINSSTEDPFTSFKMLPSTNSYARNFNENSNLIHF